MNKSVHTTIKKINYISRKKQKMSHIKKSGCKQNKTVTQTHTNIKIENMLRSKK